jgi:tetratricopeptide (TPR) repeat protein
LAGEPEAAHRLEFELQQIGDVQAPLWKGELGWWHYRKGDYQKSLDLLSEAVQQRPGDMKLWLLLAWTQIEIRRYGDALQTLDGAVYEQKIQPERAIVRAVARWQAQERDQALLDFNVAVDRQPEWENSSWVQALYSPLVAQSIQEMQAERERRRQKAKVAASR